MIRRPLNARFREAVLTGVKTTTIRPKPWPVGVPIMLYSWSGAPYRSKQDDVAVVIAQSAKPITMHRRGIELLIEVNGELMDTSYAGLICSEGFHDHAEFMEWFLPKLKRGESRKFALMTFAIRKVEA
jgi:hypothetical protein